MAPTFTTGLEASRCDRLADAVADDRTSLRAAGHWRRVALLSPLYVALALPESPTGHSRVRHDPSM